MPFGGLLTLGIIGAGTGLAGAAIGANAAGNAADVQAGAATNAANLQYSSAQQALDFAKQQWNTQQANFAPWLQEGQGAILQLSNLLGISPPTVRSAGTPAAPGPTPQETALQNRINALQSRDILSPGEQRTLDNLIAEQGQMPGRTTATPAPPGRTAANPSSLVMSNLLGAPASGPAGPPGAFPTGATGPLTGWNVPFTPPTNLTEANDPGFQARLALGQQVLENSAAARGGLISGGTAKDLTRYGQDYASNEYSNVYNRSLQNYNTAYNVFQNNQANTFNRLASIAGYGQTAAGQLGALGQGTSGNVANILLGSGSQIGQSIQNAAAARASGYVGGANAYGGALSNLGGSLSSSLLLSQLLGGQQGTIPPPDQPVAG